MVDLRPGSADCALIRQQVADRAVAPDREHRWVLQQQQVVVRGSTQDLALVEGALQVPGLGIRQSSQPANTEKRVV
jgi:hypothetical protein